MRKKGRPRQASRRRTTAKAPLVSKHATNKEARELSPFFLLPEAEEVALYEMAVATKRVEPLLSELAQKGVPLNSILTILWKDLSYKTKYLLNLHNRVVSLAQKQLGKDKSTIRKQILATVKTPPPPPKSLKEALFPDSVMEDARKLQELMSVAASLARGKKVLRQGRAAIGKKGLMVEKARDRLMSILRKHGFNVSQAANHTFDLLQQWNCDIAPESPDAIRVAYYRTAHPKS